MAGSLRDDLASLRIERREPAYRPEPAARSRPARGGGGMRLLALLIWLIPLALIGGGAYVAYSQYDQIRPRTKVDVGLVQAMTEGEAETLLSAKGYIKSDHQAMIGAKMPGRVEQMLVDEGVRVEKGQLLAVLEHDDLKAMLESRKAGLIRTEAELAEARTDLSFKESQVQRRNTLQARGTITGEEMEQYLFDRDKARSRLRAIEAELKAQQSTIREVESQIANMHIYAPFDGTITEQGAELGETITPGGMGAASGRGSVATLADLDHLEVETDVAENLLSRVRPADPATNYLGQPAEISVTAVSDRRYHGRLTRIIPMGDRSRGTVKVDVVITDPDSRLFPDLAATVHFLPDVNAAARSESFLFVPRASVFEDAGHSFVWVVDTKQAVRRRQIEVAAAGTEGDGSLRVEKGLDANERVVLHPPEDLKDGEIVQVND
jgi:RND family efflux transporter MFP subunit